MAGHERPKLTTIMISKISLILLPLSKLNGSVKGDGGSLPVRPNAALFQGCDEHVIISLTLRESNDLANGKEDKIDQDGEGGDGRVGQEVEPLKRGMDNEHGVYVISHLLGNEGFENKIAIKTDRVHHQNRYDDVGHISLKPKSGATEEGEKQNVEKQSGMGNDTLRYVIIRKGGVSDEINVGEHSHKSGHDSEPENIISEKSSEARIGFFQECIYQARPHNNVTRVYG